MATETTTKPEGLTQPDNTASNGIETWDVGEDGAIFALGHVDPEAMVVAICEHAESVWGAPWSDDDIEDTLVDEVRHRMAHFQPDEGGEWRLWWGDPAPGPRGLPITMVDAP